MSVNCLYPTTKEAILDYIKMEPSADKRKEAEEILSKIPDEIIAEDNYLANRFNKFINFGTAGIRGTMESGFNRINSLTICGIAQGICMHFSTKKDDKSNHVIVGYDGRKDSKNFANIVAAVLICKGYTVYLPKTCLATPLVPFGVLFYKCDFGIQITASHNVKSDNGVKIYQQNGLQLSVVDEETLYNTILANKEPWVADLQKFIDLSTFKLTAEAEKSIKEPNDLFVNYKNVVINGTIKKYLTSPLTNMPKIVYTPLHGVGAAFVEDILKLYGYSEAAGNLKIVSEQKEPNPEFRTVLFPNPEEAGSLLLATQTADLFGAKIVIANDPDADRFALAERLSTGWHIYSGDQIGALFAAYLMYSIKDIPKSSQIYLNSAVSSRMLHYMATIEGCQHFESMTGFKNLMDLAKLLEKEKKGTVVFCYEEALGYALDVKNVPDKDGMSAIAFFIEMFAFVCQNFGGSVFNYLQSLYKKCGFFTTKNSYGVCNNINTMKEILDEFKQFGNYPSTIGSYKVSRIQDFANGYDSLYPVNVCQYPLSSPMVTIHFDNDCHVTLRASGTEPKIKYYSEIRTSSMDDGKRILSDVVNSVIESVLKPSVYGIRMV